MRGEIKILLIEPILPALFLFSFVKFRVLRGKRKNCNTLQRGELMLVIKHELKQIFFLGFQQSSLFLCDLIEQANLRFSSQIKIFNLLDKLVKQLLI